LDAPHTTQLVGVGVRLDVQHLGHQHSAQFPALGLGPLDLQALAGERLGHRLEIDAGR
jgi:hypothetical protein